MPHPMRATVIGEQVDAIGADRQAILSIKEVDIKQGHFQFRIKILQRPGLAAIAAVQDGGVVANGPQAITDCGDIGQGGLHGHELSLLPLMPVGRQQHMTALTHRNKSRLSLCDTQDD